METNDEKVSKGLSDELLTHSRVYEERGEEPLQRQRAALAEEKARTLPSLANASNHTKCYVGSFSGE